MVLFLGISHQKKFAPTQIQPPINMVNFETSSKHNTEMKGQRKNLWIHFALSQKCLLQKSY